LFKQTIFVDGVGQHIALDVAQRRVENRQLVRVRRATLQRFG
jgi:hypothetical protein